MGAGGGGVVALLLASLATNAYHWLVNSRPIVVEGDALGTECVQGLGSLRQALLLCAASLAATVVASFWLGRRLAGASAGAAGGATVNVQAVSVATSAPSAQPSSPAEIAALADSDDEAALAVYKPRRH